MNGDLLEIALALSAQSANDDCANEGSFCDKLQLARHNVTWNVQIVHVNSTTEIWIRLLDAEHKNVFELLNEELAASRSMQVPSQTIGINEIYLTQDEDSKRWHRIRIEAKVSTDELQSRYSCFFMDVGCCKELPESALYVCDKRLTEIPAQAIQLALSDLDELEEHPYALDFLNTLIGQKFKAKPIEAVQLTHIRDHSSPIFVALYDENDNEYNSIIFNRIMELIPLQKISEKFLNSKVSHVSEIGFVYLQLDLMSLCYVENLIDKLANEGMKSKMLDPHSSNISNIALIYDDQRGGYYRAHIFAQVTTELFKCFYLDYGIIGTVNSSNIFELTGSPILLRYPGQAIPVKLDRVLSFDRKIVERLRGLLVGQPKIVVKVIDEQLMPPSVSIFKRSQPDNNLIHVNELIRLETELIDSAAANIDFDDSFY